jgi:hypothetical protein
VFVLEGKLDTFEFTKESLKSENTKKSLMM